MQYLGLYTGCRIRVTTFDCGGVNDPNCTTLLYCDAKCTRLRGCPKCFPRCYVAPSSDDDEENICSTTKRKLTITGLKHAEAKAACGEKVTLVHEPENVRVHALFLLSFIGV